MCYERLAGPLCDPDPDFTLDPRRRSGLVIGLLPVSPPFMLWHLSRDRPGIHLIEFAKLNLKRSLRDYMIVFGTSTPCSHP